MEISRRLQALDFTETGWHDTQVMPNLKPSMGHSTGHSVSVVVVVSERQGENHFSLNQIPMGQSDCALSTVNDRIWLSDQPYYGKWSVKS